MGMDFRFSVLANRCAGFSSSWWESALKHLHCVLKYFGYGALNQMLQITEEESERMQQHVNITPVKRPLLACC